MVNRILELQLHNQLEIEKEAIKRLDEFYEAVKAALYHRRSRAKALELQLHELQRARFAEQAQPSCASGRRPSSPNAGNSKKLSASDIARLEALIG